MPDIPWGILSFHDGAKKSNLRLRGRCGRLRSGLLLSFGVEDLVLIISHADVGAVSDHSDGVCHDVSLAARWQPQLVIDQLLVEDEIASFADGEESEAKMKVVIEPGDEAANLAVPLIDPDGSRQFF